MKIHHKHGYARGRLISVSSMLAIVLGAAILFGLTMGSSGHSLDAIGRWIGGAELSPMTANIIWKIRLPRVLMGLLMGASLSLGGLVFQALLRNPLAEPYILGISGGSAIGAILGILLGLSRFPGVMLLSFMGSLAALGLILMLSSGQSLLGKDALLLSGVMLNAFCSAIIMFLISITQDSRLHNIMFWLMGDLTLAGLGQIGVMAVILVPCWLSIFSLAHPMNLLVMGRESALTMGINVRAVTLTLLIVTSLMVSATVSYGGLIGFVGLVIPHLLRLLFGPDHRILVPACLLGGGAYMVVCDTLARTLPSQGEMPSGVVTAMIGAPVFIWLLKKSAGKMG